MVTIQTKKINTDTIINLGELEYTKYGREQYDGLYVF